MPFIGNKPTALPLSADDLEDNIISTAKIQDNAVTAAKYIEPIPFRNIIINGDMSIAQRGTSTSSISVGNTITVDRFVFTPIISGTWTQSQSTDVPTGQGFAKSTKLDCTSANASLSAGSALIFEQRFEGQNLQYLKKGTANAESLTISFWVKSNKTGTYIVEIDDNDNSRNINKSYTINSANTWEKKTITFAGDTTGTLDNDNGLSLRVFWWLAAGTDFNSGTLATSWESTTSANRAVGQVNLADSTANEWYITGVQLEAGTTASDFEFLPVDVNLGRCQRYYQVFVEGNSNYFMNGHYYYSTNVRGVARFFKPMRASATLDMVTGTDYYKIFRDSGNDLINSFTAIANNQSSILYNSTEASGTAGQAGDFITNNASAFIAFDAEL